MHTWNALNSRMTGKRPALLAHGSRALQITLFGGGLAESRQAEAGAHRRILAHRA